MMIQGYFSQLKATQEDWLWPHRPDSSPRGMHALRGGQRCCHEMAGGEKCELEKPSEGAQSNSQGMPVHPNVDTFICNSLRTDYSSVINPSSFFKKGYMAVVVSKIFPPTNGIWYICQNRHFMTQPGWTLGQGQGEFSHPPEPSAALSLLVASNYTGRSWGSSLLSYTGQEILAWNKKAAAAKIPMPESPFPSAAREEWLGSRSVQQSPAPKQGRPQPNPCGLQTGEMPSGSSEQNLTPVPSKLFHLAPGLVLEGASGSWGEQSAHRTKNT